MRHGDVCCSRSTPNLCLMHGRRVHVMVGYVLLCLLCDRKAQLLLDVGLQRRDLVWWVGVRLTGLRVLLRLLPR